MKANSKTAKQTTVTLEMLTAIEKTAARKFAGIRAHLHPSFQNERTPAERKEIEANVAEATRELQKYFPRVYTYVTTRRPGQKMSFAQLAASASKKAA